MDRLIFIVILVLEVKDQQQPVVAKRQAAYVYLKDVIYHCNALQPQAQ